MNYKVNILLSSYNGEQYIEQQITSLLAQEYQNINILIRDDGSTDNTPHIIAKFQNEKKQIQLIRGENLGIAASFIQLLNLVDTNEMSLYAFCDQDDVWKPDKIVRAVKNISSSPEPDKALYCSRLEYVDEQLNHLGFSLIPEHIGFKNAVVENIATGCTMVFGNKTREYMLMAKPEHMMMHDWWAYLIASSFGNVIYDVEPTVLYRQHINSATEWEPGLTKVKNRSKGFFRRLLANKHQGLDSLNQAIRFIETYSDINRKDQIIVEKLVELRRLSKILARIKYIFRPSVCRNDKLENWLLKLMILFGMH